MVTQDISKVTPKILASGLLSLREYAIMPRIVNTSYSTDAAQRGSTVDVPLPSAVTGGDVNPGATPEATDGIAPTTVPITLNKWKRAGFQMSDKEVLEAMNGVVPMQASAAIRWLVNQIDLSILQTAYQGTYQYVGHATYNPFDPDVAYTGSSTQKVADATNMRKALNKGLAPMDGRAVVATVDVEANALQLRPFNDTSWSGSADALVNGNLNQKLGFRWFMDQNIPAHTAGTITGTVSVSGTPAAGDKTITLATDASEAVNLQPGDLFKFSNHTQVYVVTSGINIGASTSGSVSFLPGLVTTVTGASVSHPASFANGNTYYNSLGFHRDAIAFASRQFDPVPPGLGVFVDQVVDEVSGVALRLQVKREHYRTTFTYDALWGTALIRPEHCVRLIGSV